MDKVTAGRDAMSKFAPKFAELNDDVLFGEVWIHAFFIILSGPRPTV